MSNTARAFERGKAFIPFITAGDPDLETTAALVRAMAEAGADLVELGVPFSDPTAEGPVIMEANVRSLSGGTTTDGVFKMVEDLRAELSIPLAFMTYANVVYSYGTDRFLDRAGGVGIDALILPDVPYEERAEFAPACSRCGVDLVSLIAPTSDDRIKTIARDAQGFLYIVSSLGVTGVRSEITTDIPSMVRRIRESTDVPCAVGFGISRPDQAREMASCSDGVIVGSAIVKIIAEHGRAAVPHVAAYVREMKDAIRQEGR